MSAPLDPARASILALFVEELETHGGRLAEGLGLLAAGEAGRDTLEGLARAARAVKGGALLAGVNDAARVTERVEGCLAAALAADARPDAAAVRALQEGVELLRRAAAEGAERLEATLEERRTEVDRLCAALDRAATVASGPVGAVPGPGEGAGVAPEGPASRPEAVERGERRPPQEPHDLGSASLLDLFRFEADAQTRVLANGLLALEEEPGGGGVEVLMRAAHSLKGAARVVQLEPVVRLAHRLEDCLVAARDGRVRLGSDAVDVLLAAVDLLATISQLEEGSVDPWLERNADGVAGLERAMQGVRDGAAPLGWSRRARGVAAPVAEALEATVRVDGGGPPAAAGGEAGATGGGVGEGPREVRISADNLDRLMGLAGESLVQAGWLEGFAAALAGLKRAQEGVADSLEAQDPATAALRPEERQAAWAQSRELLGACRANLLDRMDELDTFSRRAVDLSSRLYRAVIASRMRPFEDAVGGFRRLVRDLARALGKKVRLEVRGLRTDVDRDIVERLEAPLNHLLRNAVDHAVEPPRERLAAGKPEVGTVVVEARHRAGRLVITVSDDGRGVDLDQLRASVQSRQLTSPEMVARMGEAELLEFLFLPGFTTAEEVTEISGRGVGLDVVSAMVHEVGGTLRAANRSGHGMTFSLELPLTRSVVRTLLVEVAGEPLAIPLARIDRTLKVPLADVDVVEDRQYHAFDGANVGLVSAHQVLELGESEAQGEVLPVVVVSDQLNRYGLVVDRFLGEHDLVVRPLDRRLGKVADIAAVAILPSGSPVLIVDVDDLVRSVDNLVGGRRLRKVGRVARETAARRVLVVDDSLTVREVERQLLESRGYEVEVAVDGMDAWNAVLAGSYDLVVTDVDMPRMTGFELVERVKSDPQHRSLPVVIVSYKDREEDRLRGLEVGADYYLTKGSFHDDTLLDAVNDLIGPATP